MVASDEQPWPQRGGDQPCAIPGKQGGCVDMPPHSPDECGTQKGYDGEAATVDQIQLPHCFGLVVRRALGDGDRLGLRELSHWC